MCLGLRLLTFHLAVLLQLQNPNAVWRININYGTVIKHWAVENSPLLHCRLYFIFILWAEFTQTLISHTLHIFTGDFLTVIISPLSGQQSQHTASGWKMEYLRKTKKCWKRPELTAWNSEQTSYLRSENEKNHPADKHQGSSKNSGFLQELDYLPWGQ